MFLLEDGWPYTLLMNTYPTACSPYTQKHIPASSIPTHKFLFIFRQIWVKDKHGESQWIAILRIPWALLSYINQKCCPLLSVLQTVFRQALGVGRPRSWAELCSLACPFIRWWVGVWWWKVRDGGIIAWPIEMVTVRSLMGAETVW